MSLATNRQDYFPIVRSIVYTADYSAEDIGLFKESDLISYTRESRVEGHLMFHVTEKGFSLMEKYYRKKYQIFLSYILLPSSTTKLRGEHLPAGERFWGVIVQQDKEDRHVVPLLFRKQGREEIEGLIVDSLGKATIESYQKVAPFVKWHLYSAPRQASAFGCAIDALVFLKDALRRPAEMLDQLFQECIEIPPSFRDGRFSFIPISPWVGKLTETKRESVDPRTFVLGGSKRGLVPLGDYIKRDHMPVVYLEEWVDPDTDEAYDPPLFHLRHERTMNMFLSKKGRCFYNSVDKYLQFISDEKKL